MMEKTNLVSEWVELKTKEFSSIKDVLNELNSAVDMSISHSRLQEYQQSNDGAEELKRKRKRPSIRVINYMLADVLEHLLKEDGLSQNRINEIVSKVTIIGD
ncbi:TPA: hypothetical protein RQO57_004495 [Aeromonas dhakensis]|uniref:hypothetical protein n=1 Tax=Aeromonas dhakensis TaxID=196024 RepID=UPI0028910C0C|nr:hypothetical protein [Aeromonas dhakensis]